jgi:hypothetical protein
VKRGEVEERYSPMLEAWYGSKARVLWEGVEASAERAAA